MTAILRGVDFRSVPAKGDIRFLDAASKARSQDEQARSMIRRPMRGMQVKRDTPAVLSILDAQGAPAEIYNSSGPVSDGKNTKVGSTSNFLLRSVTHNRAEKVQIVTTFSDAFLYAYGEQPAIVSFSALVLNSEDFPWHVEWWANYAETFRATRLVERGLIASISYDDVIVTGYMLNASSQQTEADVHGVGISFSMWVTDLAFKIDPDNRMFRAGDADDFPEFRLDPKDEGTGEFVSSTAAVRNANVEALSQGAGIVGWLTQAVNKLEGWTGQVGEFVRASSDALYGRNLRLPPGFAASSINAGPAEFATGSGISGISGLLYGLTTIRLPADFDQIRRSDKLIRGAYYDSRDEYPFTAETPLSTEEGQSRFNDAFQVYRGGDLYVFGTDRPATEEDIVRRATDQWAKAGTPISAQVGASVDPNQTGVGLFGSETNSDLVALITKASYGAVAYGGTFSGGLPSGVGDSALNATGPDTVNSLAKEVRAGLGAL